MTGRKKELQLLVGTSAMAIAMALSASAMADTGAKMGSGTLNAEVTGSVSRSTNVFAAERGEQDDTFYRVTPSVSWNSDWASGNEFGLSAEAIFTDFDSFGRDDADEYNLGLTGLVNVNNATSVSYNAGYASIVEDRGNAVDFGSLEPVEVEVLTGGIALNRTGGRFEIEVGANITDKDYEDGVRTNPASGVGVPARLVVNNDDRDATITEVHGRVDYAVRNRSAVYVEGAYNWREFDQREDNTGLSRDSDGYTVGAGVTVQLSDVSQISLGANYHDQSFDDAGFRDVDGFGGVATFVWLPSDLTTVTASVTHQYEDTSLGGISGSLTQGGALQISHQLLSNMNVTLDFTASTSEYEGRGAVALATEDREDDTYTAGINVGYDLSDHVSLGANADYVERDSNVAGDDYERTRYGASLTVRM